MKDVYKIIVFVILVMPHWAMGANAKYESYKESELYLAQQLNMNGHQISILTRKLEETRDHKQRALILKKMGELIFENAVDSFSLLKAVEIMHQALDEAEKSRDLALLSKIQVALGNLHRHLKKPIEAYRYYELASKTAKDIDPISYFQSEITKCVLCCEQIVRNNNNFISTIEAQNKIEINKISCCYDRPKKLLTEISKTGDIELEFLLLNNYQIMLSWISSKENYSTRLDIDEKLINVSYRLLTNRDRSEYDYYASQIIIDKTGDLIRKFPSYANLKKVIELLSGIMEKITLLDNSSLLYKAQLNLGIARQLIHEEPDKAIKNLESAFHLADRSRRSRRESNYILIKLSELYTTMGQFSEAIEVTIKGQKLTEQMADLQNQWHMVKGNIYDIEGKYSFALDEYEKAMHNAKTRDQLAEIKYNMSFTLQNVGKYEAARQMLLESLSLRGEKLEELIGFKEKHPIPSPEQNQEYYIKKLPEFLEALAESGITDSTRNIDLDHLLNMIGLNYSEIAKSYYREGSYSKAKENYLKAAIWYQRLTRKIQVGKHPKTYGDHETTIGLVKLALLDKNIPLAREYFNYYDSTLDVSPISKQSIFEAEKLLLLGKLEFLNGEFDKAETFYKQSLNILESSFGIDHPSMFSCLVNLAILYASTNKHHESHRQFRQAISVANKIRQEAFLVLNERQKLSYMSQNEFNINTYISHTSRFLSSEILLVTDAFEAWLKWKGAVMEAQGRYIDAIYHSDNPMIQEKYNELTKIRRERAKLYFSKPTKMSYEGHKKRIAELSARKDDLETRLSMLSKDFALEKLVGNANVKTILTILPEDSIYLDFAKITMYDFKNNKVQSPRYLAFVLIPGKKPEVKLINIADAGEIEEHIKAYHNEINSIKNLQYTIPPDPKFLNKEARELYNKLIKPLELLISGKKHVYISPDGDLNLIPFEVMLDPEGNYLIKKDYKISYISAGRDIVRFMDTARAEGDSLIIANPDYNMGLKEKEQVLKELKLKTTIMGQVSRDAAELRFEPLPKTKEEANEIEKILHEKLKYPVKNLQEKRALEEVLFGINTPRLLHLATHGYFLKNEEIKQIRKDSLMTQGVDQLPDTGLENPMLRSGIALAGVNASLKEGKDDGLVSAEKILGLRLKGSELVVLSACETGLGDVKSGEGVFGLKRAFILSGAKSVVMSLWSVPSAATTELMTEFYRLISEGKPKAEALKDAKLSIMEKTDNPFFWGAFVMVGNPN